MGLRPSGEENFELVPGFLGNVVYPLRVNVQLSARCRLFCCSSGVKNVFFYSREEVRAVSCNVLFVYRAVI
jgi:hypothetical protein